MKNTSKKNLVGEDVDKFMNKAPDEIILMTKVAH